eukprot:CAMPEP_0116144100 /NCGR_PEP_ID=MMETSP0329-20121206/15810_1 /TAXON_ID=697910 /ORGANISM="Pseudo-nitzschia arenysensis, Strain B593" /LENGTH=513 /DNA_ID=CAMNT_0003639477 /DNA_START=101 /DNA_END=1642 /DNA_ORIENTATION=-
MSTTIEKKRECNVITVTKDFDIRNNKYIEMHSSFEIDQVDCRIVDGIIQYQRENAKDPAKSAQISNLENAFKTRRTMVEIQNDDKHRRVRSLSLANAVCDKLPLCILGLDALEILDLSNAHLLESIPAWIGKLSNLRELYLPNLGRFTRLPDAVWDLRKLQIFAYAHWNASHESSRLDISIPSSIGQMTNLRELRMAEVAHLPEEIGNLSNSLELLELPTFKGDSLPISIGKLTKLRALVIQKAPLLRSLPESIGDLTSLQKIILQDSGIQSLPNSIGNLNKLRCLSLDRNLFLETLPDSIGDLASLTAMSMERSGIKSLPDSVGNLSIMTYCNLKNSKIQLLPDTIGNFSSLIWLELSGSRINSLPETKHLKNMKSLKFLKVGNTALSSSQDGLREIALELPMLGCFGDIEHGDTTKDLAILRALSFNRASHRIFHPLNQKDSETVSFPRLSLWPHILANTKSASTVYPHCNYRFRYCRCCDTTPSQSQSDTVFRLLVEYGATFLSPGSATK